MAESSDPVAVYLEVGKKRTLAGAIDWPGWCRGGRDEEAALQALIDYGPRYERIMQTAGIDFHAPADVSKLTIVERVEGNTTTDFGAPAVEPSSDSAPVDETELRHLRDFMKACWAALDAAQEAAYGKDLRKGPRGGGRDLQDVVGHVLGAEKSYVTSLGGKLSKQASEDEHEAITGSALDQRRQLILDALAGAAHGEFPQYGPRGGMRWTPRYFVRRSAWHILDHVWEIEDRAR
ncbi:MAG: hypothetical protein ABI670_06765 [Chloroflexota bacterium]